MVKIARINSWTGPEDDIFGTDEPALRTDSDSTLKRSHSVQYDIVGLADLIVA